MSPAVSEKSFALGSLLPGPVADDGGVTYVVWAPDHGHLSVRVWRRESGKDIVLPMEARERGYFALHDPDGRAGDRYKFVRPDGAEFPDPASRFQPEGVHGPSEVIDHRAYAWQSTTWKRPAWSGQAIYELHVGTFTPEGTFRAAIERLDHIASLGVGAIELMPVADFPGGRNWGYDGVTLFAPARCYGRPDDLRALVDAAHVRGLAVILDVVYNHLGPDGNYLGAYAKEYFDADRHTPWGQAFHLAGRDSRPVREFFLSNAAYWLDEFRFDGLRLDATHAILDVSEKHLLSAIADVAHARGAFLIAEDERNTTEILCDAKGAGAGLDAAWADDFHHEVRVALTGIREGYFAGYRGTPEELARTLTSGWFYTGQPFASWKGRARGSPCGHLPTRSFVFCIENHDQVGNRAQGERLEHLVSRDAFLAASALLCLSPYPPMLFMGQEWAAGSPFQYFTEHGGDLGRAVSEGRKREFAEVGMNASLRPEDVPDPQALETFTRSKLDWSELEKPEHASVLAFYRCCFALRAELLGDGGVHRDRWSVAALNRAVALRFNAGEKAPVLLVCSLWGEARVEFSGNEALRPPSGMVWQVVLDSRETGAAQGPVETLELPTAATVLLRAVSCETAS